LGGFVALLVGLFCMEQRLKGAEEKKVCGKYVSTAGSDGWRFERAAMRRKTGAKAE
jgi:hypothetical protein